MALKASIKKRACESVKSPATCWPGAGGPVFPTFLERWDARGTTRPLPCSCQRKLEPYPFSDTGNILLLSQGNCKYDWTTPNGSCTEVQGQGKKKKKNHADKQGRNESLDRQEWSSVSSRYLGTPAQKYTLCERDKQKPHRWLFFFNFVFYAGKQLIAKTE